MRGKGCAMLIVQPTNTERGGRGHPAAPPRPSSPAGCPGGGQFAGWRDRPAARRRRPEDGTAGAQRRFWSAPPSRAPPPVLRTAPQAALALLRTRRSPCRGAPPLRRRQVTGLLRAAGLGSADSSRHPFRPHFKSAAREFCRAGRHWAAAGVGAASVVWGVRRGGWRRDSAERLGAAAAAEYSAATWSNTLCIHVRARLGSKFMFVRVFVRQRPGRPGRCAPRAARRCCQAAPRWRPAPRAPPGPHPTPAREAAAAAARKTRPAAPRWACSAPPKNSEHVDAHSPRRRGRVTCRQTKGAIARDAAAVLLTWS